MRVLLKQDWFGPNAHLYVRDRLGNVVPDEFRDALPAGTVILDKTEAPVPVAVEPLATLRDFDVLRAEADAEDAVAAKAETSRLAGTRKPPRS